MHILSSIPTFDESIHFWMIRAKRGFFFDEFIRCGYIAIGWNLIKKSDLNTSRSKSRESALKEKLQEEYDEKLPGAALNKCMKFLNEVKKDDIAMIVGKDKIAFAQIGDYYEVAGDKFSVESEKQIHQNIEGANINTDCFECPYVKRRKIEVIRIIDADEFVNPYLYRAMVVNRHSLSELSEYAEIILSACYDSFAYKGKLNITFRVEQDNSINAIALATFISCSAQILSSGDISAVSVKTALHSPGDIVLQVWNFAQENPIALLVCYMAVFGGKIGRLEFNSLVSVVKDLINSRYTAQKHAIELRKEAAQARLAEQEAISKELENIEKLRELQIVNADKNIEPLMEAAEQLRITPSPTTIVDIQKYLEKHAPSNSTEN